MRLADAQVWGKLPDVRFGVFFELSSLYLEDCQVAGPRTKPSDEGGCEAWALDAAAAERLWRVSEEMVGERFSVA